MNLHKITPIAQQVYIWLTPRSRSTFRDASVCHLWSPGDTPVPPIETPRERFRWMPFGQIEVWNRAARPPAALCGYRPNQHSMSLQRYSTYNHCYRCQQAAERSGILYREITRATRDHPRLEQLGREHDDWLLTQP